MQPLKALAGPDYMCWWMLKGLGSGLRAQGSGLGLGLGLVLRMMSGQGKPRIKIRSAWLSPQHGALKHPPGRSSSAVQRESWWDGSEDSGDLLSPARAMALESWDVTPEAASPEQVRRRALLPEAAGTMQPCSCARPLKPRCVCR